MPIASDRFCLIVPVSILLKVLLPDFIGVADCGCSNSIKHCQMHSASCAFKYSAPTSASAADAITILMIIANTNMGSLNFKFVLLPK